MRKKHKTLRSAKISITSANSHSSQIRNVRPSSHKAWHRTIESHKYTFFKPEPHDNDNTSEASRPSQLRKRIEQLIAVPHSRTLEEGLVVSGCSSVGFLAAGPFCCVLTACVILGRGPSLRRHASHMSASSARLSWTAAASSDAARVCSSAASRARSFREVTVTAISSVRH